MALSSLSMSLSSSSSPATVAVEKATSDLLINPDWTMNMDICDSVNSHLWQAKDVIKAVKKRLQHKSPRVQLLALTLLETLVKNCGDNVHFQIADRNLLGEMVKIVKKKTDMQVRDKILILLDSWQEAFGGPRGKCPQYYWAYDELRRSGIEFPKRSPDAVPIFTPPVAHAPTRDIQPGYGMPSSSSRRLDETMATEIESLSLSSLESMRDVMELLNDMLQAVNPEDREAVKDEVIVDLVNRCRSNQKKLMQMLTTTGDEELLGRGLELNDSLQSLLAKHDAIASGTPLPSQAANSSPSQRETRGSDAKTSEKKESSPSTLAAGVVRFQIDEEEEEEDEFAQLARRHSRARPAPSSDSKVENSEGLQPSDSSDTTASSVPGDSTSVPSNALALGDPSPPARTTKEQDIIDLLSLSLTTTSTSSDVPQVPPAATQSINEVHPPSSPQGNAYTSQMYGRSQGQAYNYGWNQGQVYNYGGNQGQASNNYIVPWARPQVQPQRQTQYPPQSTNYPPPPWVETSGYPSSQHSIYPNAIYSSSQSNPPTNNTTPLAGASAGSPHTTMPAGRSLQHTNSFPSGNMLGSSNVTTSPKLPTQTPGQKAFVPSYRLFEDLNVLGNADGRLKTNGSSTSLSGSSGQGMVGGRK